MTETASTPSSNTSPGIYYCLRPVLRRFVDLIVQGQKGTDAVRELRPKLARPDVQAAKWRALPEVQQAIDERRDLLLDEAGADPHRIVEKLVEIALRSESAKDVDRIAALKLLGEWRRLWGNRFTLQNPDGSGVLDGLAEAIRKAATQGPGATGE